MSTQEKSDTLASRNLNNICIVEGCENPCWKLICRGCGRKIRTGTLLPPPGSNVFPNPECEVAGCSSPSVTRLTSRCRAHYEAGLAGRDAESLRPKKRKLDDPKSCSITGCKSESKVHGMCQSHYGASKRITHPCSAPGCDKSTKSDMCKTHSDQFSKHRVTWNGKRPEWIRESIRSERELGKPDCSVPHCANKATSSESILCKTHKTDRRRKGMDDRRYISMFSILACESCGITGVRLVTDHDHSHHPDHPEKMCPDCYRGRICSDCNTALGLLRDGSNIRNLLKYARKFNPDL